MQHLSDLLATIAIPPRDADSAHEARCTGSPLLKARLDASTGLAHDLAADMPAGHLHVWGGPGGAGKISFLLSLLHSAAAHGRRVVYATYDLAPNSLALRMLAMVAGVPLKALPDPGAAVEACTLEGEQLERVRDAHDTLSRLPFSFLPARGFGVRSIGDRLVRMPFRAEVLAVDYLQGVIREPDTDTGITLRALSDMAAHLHVAVICTVRAEDPNLDPNQTRDGRGAVEEGAVEEGAAQAIGASGGERDAGARLPFGCGLEGTSAWDPTGGAAEDADRIGWIAPTAGVRESAAGDGGATAPGVRAEVLHNRHGGLPSVPLHLDAATGSLERL